MESIEEDLVVRNSKSAELLNQPHLRYCCVLKSHFTRTHNQRSGNKHCDIPTKPVYQTWENERSRGATSVAGTSTRRSIYIRAVRIASRRMPCSLPSSSDTDGGGYSALGRRGAYRGRDSTGRDIMKPLRFAAFSPCLPNP